MIVVKTVLLPVEVTIILMHNDKVISNVLIVEDEASIAMDLQDILESNGYAVCGIAYSYDQAVSLLAAKQPDVVLLDIALKGRETGLDVAKVITEKYSIPFVFLTSFIDSDTVATAVDLKPSSYLVKPFKEKDIVPSIVLALSQRPDKTTSGIPSLDYINSIIDKRLSPQEYKVLNFLCQGCTNKDIASRLFVSPNTVKTHLYKLYQKLNTNSRSLTVSKVMNL